MKRLWPDGWDAPHKVIWRVMWAPLTYGTLVLFCLAILIAYGPEGAKRAWRDAT